MKLAPTLSLGLLAVLATAAACGSGTTPDCADASACEVAPIEMDSSTPPRDSGKDTGGEIETGVDTGMGTETGPETSTEAGDDGGNKKDSSGGDAAKESGAKDAGGG